MSRFNAIVIFLSIFVICVLACSCTSDDKTDEPNNQNDSSTTVTMQTDSSTYSTRDESEVENDLSEQELIDIALTSPEAQKLLEEYHVYEPSVAWVAILWSGSEIHSWYGTREKKTIGEILPNPAGLPLQTSFNDVTGEGLYRVVHLKFGDPPKRLFSIAIDTESKEIVCGRYGRLGGGPTSPP